MKNAWLALLIPFCLISQVSLADSGCLTQLKVVLRWDGATNDLLACIPTKSQGQAGLAVLCSTDGLTFSPHFAEYLAFRARWREAFNAYVDTKEAAQKATELQNLRAIEKAWAQSGFSDEVDIAIWQVRTAKSDCFDRM